jgi:hypothetical protein
MTFLPLLLLAAAGSRVALDDTIEIARAEWRFVEITARQAQLVVNCEFEALSNSGEVRAVWIARKDLESFRSGTPENIIAATPYGASGKLRSVAPGAGSYAMAFQNPPSARGPVRVRAKVWLDPAASPRYASPGRRLAVIFISCVFFFAVVSVSAMKLRQGLR